MVWRRRWGDRLRRARAGFTLIELLVVVASLMVLAAILLPIFTRARQSSYRVQCASNLRQLASAFYQYSLDWNGYWPSPGGRPGDRVYWAQSGNGGLYPYLKQRGLRSVWCCPLLNDWHGKYPARSYMMNSCLRNVPDVEYPRCTRPAFQGSIDTAIIVERARTILLYEGTPRSVDYHDTAYTEDQIFSVYRCANWTWARGFKAGVIQTIDSGHPWHGRSNNYLYADGHVVARPPGRQVHVELSTYREMRQWYVSKSYFEYIFTKDWSRWVSRDLQ